MGRSTRIGRVEDALALDIRRLRRLGIARTGECVCDTVQWSIGGLSASSALLRVDLSDIERGGTMRITGDMPGATIDQTIAIVGVPSSIAGWRCYFVCPVTARRCEILYYAHGRLASRQAQRLYYAIKGMDDLSRARRKAAKLRSRLQGTSNFPRVRGVNRMNTVRKLREVEFEAKTLHLDRLRDLADRSGARWMPGDQD